MAGYARRPSKEIRNERDLIHCPFLLPSKNTQLTNEYNHTFSTR